uniref:Uncharacterized protein n=1 Tax=Arundo donax TaxID=35708 RepID=A0A0A8ZWQ1_ARUDO
MATVLECTTTRLQLQFTTASPSPLITSLVNCNLQEVSLQSQHRS